VNRSASIETRVRVRYAETDQMGVVYHSNYLIWMEVGRVELCRALGMRYRDLEAAGVRLAVAEASCRYHSPARYDDEVIILARVERAHTRMVEFGYTMTSSETGKLLVTGMTKHIFVDHSMKPIRLPIEYQPLFGITAGTPK
jgi:acyl-CoA thioester hydrolase